MLPPEFTTKEKKSFLNNITYISRRKCTSIDRKYISCKVFTIGQCFG